MKTRITAAVLSLGLGAAANAAFVIPTTVVHSGTYTTDASPLAGLINGSGLSGTPTEDATAGGVTHLGDNSELASKWVSGDPNTSAGDFFSPTAGTVQLDFNLGSAQDIQAVYVWGYYYFGNGNSATSVDVSYSTDGTSFSGLETIALTTPSLAEGALAADVVLLNNALVGTTHVRFLFQDNGFDGAGPNAGGDRVGLGEVRFGTAAVPEPSSAALLCLGGLALIRRRRK